MSEAQEFSREIENIIASLRGLPNDGSRSRRRHEQPLGDAIDKLLQKYKVGIDAPDHTIRTHWAEIVGSANASPSPAHSCATPRSSSSTRPPPPSTARASR